MSEVNDIEADIGEGFFGLEEGFYRLEYEEGSLIRNTSAEYRISTEDANTQVKITSIVLPIFTIHNRYDLYSQKSYVATGVSSFLSFSLFFAKITNLVLRLFTSETALERSRRVNANRDFVVYDHKNVNLGEIDGKIVQTAQASFDLKNASQHVLATAEVFHRSVNILDKNGQQLGTMIREYAEHKTDLWKLHVCKNYQELDVRVLFTFAAYIVHHQESWEGKIDR